MTWTEAARAMSDVLDYKKAMRTVTFELRDEPVLPFKVRVHRFVRSVGAFIRTPIPVDTRRRQMRLALVKRLACRSPCSGTAFEQQDRLRCERRHFRSGE